ncbi:MAG TPA: hypothetical protein VLD67_16570 [Vicinamibacterales bacterium]|nr:hypothetical protein [Vicinamibacterales bacterium]
MDDRLAHLEARLSDLAARVTELEARVAAAEEAPASAPAPGSDLPTESGLLSRDVGAAALQEWLTLAGRTLVVLGGAYLLRALTRAGVVPTHIGVALGLIYGAPWLLLASRAASRGGQADALGHGLATALIGYPLVWEATLRFGAFTAVESALLLGALTIAALVLSFQTRLHSLAWIVSIGGSLSALGLALATGAWTAYTLLAIVVGVGTLWLGYTREWILLRWPAAAIADFMMLVATGRSLSQGASSTVLVVQFLLLIGYLGSFAWRTLIVGRNVIPFEVVQSVAVLLVGFGGAVFLIRSAESNLLLFGLGTLVLSVASYVVAFAFVERRLHVTNFFFYSLLALVFAICGLAMCFNATTSSLLCVGAALAAMVASRRVDRPALYLQGAIYAAVGVAGSGLLGSATQALLMPAGLAWEQPSSAPMAVLAAVWLVAFMPAPHSLSSGDIGAIGPRLLLAIMLAWVSMGTAVAMLLPAVGEARLVDSGVLASVRTAVMVAATLVAARAGRTDAGREAGWLMYPLLILTGVKLLLVDFLQGRPETLFVSLALYGLALIAGPRLLRQGRAASTAEAIQADAHAAAGVASGIPGHAGPPSRGSPEA